MIGRLRLVPLLAALTLCLGGCFDSDVVLQEPFGEELFPGNVVARVWSTEAMTTFYPTEEDVEAGIVDEPIDIFSLEPQRIYIVRHDLGEGGFVYALSQAEPGTSVFWYLKRFTDRYYLARELVYSQEPEFEGVESERTSSSIIFLIVEGSTIRVTRDFNFQVYTRVLQDMWQGRLNGGMDPLSYPALTLQEMIGVSETYSYAPKRGSKTIIDDLAAFLKMFRFFDEWRYWGEGSWLMVYEPI